MLYRGLRMARSELDRQFRQDQTIHLTGYTSTSRSLQVAYNFAFKKNLDGSEKVPVILEINFCSKIGLFELRGENSAFAGEDEVLVQDGLQYKVLSVHHQINSTTK